MPMAGEAVYISGIAADMLVGGTLMKLMGKVECLSNISL